MHDAPCPMSEGKETISEEQTSPEGVLRELLANPPANPEEFMARLKESGYELKPIGHHEEEKAHSFLPPQPKMVILRLDAAKNALKEQPHE